MSNAIAYHLSFHPDDANVTADECMTAYCYDTLAEAQIAAAEDAGRYAAIHAKVPAERAEWAAYALAAADACTAALKGSNADCFTVHVDNGAESRRIGYYHIRELTEGSRLPCDTCDSERGRVTYIGGGGNVIACCDTCAADDCAYCSGGGSIHCSH